MFKKKMFSKRNRRKTLTILLIPLLAVSLVFAASNILFSDYTWDRDLENYATVHFWVVNDNGVKTDLVKGQTIDADTQHMYLEVIWTSSSLKPQYMTDAAKILAGGKDTSYTRGYTSFSLSGSTYTSDTFGFKLFDTGTTNPSYIYIGLVYSGDYYVDYTYGMYSDAFIVYNSHKDVPAPQWVEKPEPITDAIVDWSYTVGWKFDYADACNVTITSPGFPTTFQHFPYNPTTSNGIQEFFYHYIPEIPMTRTFTCTLTPDYVPSQAITDTVKIGSVTWEDFNLKETFPPFVNQSVVVVDGHAPGINIQIPFIGTIGGQNFKWSVKDNPPAGVSGSWGGDIRISIMFQLFEGSGINFDIFGDTKVVLFQKGTDNRYEFQMETVSSKERPNFLQGILKVLPFLGDAILSLSQWKEVNINLNDLPAGDYRVEIRSELNSGSEVIKYLLDNWDMNVGFFSFTLGDSPFIVVGVVIGFIAVAILLYAFLKRRWNIYTGSFRYRK